MSWLAMDPSYSPQPYAQLASVLRGMGHADKARQVLFAGKERERNQHLTGLDHAWSVAMLLFVGHGHRIYYALVWVIVLTIVGGLVISWHGEFRDPDWIEDNQENPHPAWAEVTRFIGRDLYYSLDHLLPVIRLSESHYDTRLRLRGSLEGYFIFHQIMGYVLASFLIAGLSGLTK